jgi:hypothetical protein
MTDDLKQIVDLVKGLYKDEFGIPLTLSEGQAKIFECIFKRKTRRNHLMTYTQYGKSLVTALAILTRVSTYPEKWIIVAGREKQAKIIMGYIIGHVFDNDYTKGKLQLGGEDVEKLQRERSKNRLTFRHTDGTMGEVMVLSADSRNQKTAGEAVMGFGAPNVVLDEAALIDDDIEAKIFRMLGGKPDNFYLKIGNPFKRNHFWKDYEDPNFYHLNVDWVQGIKEGRLTEDFIREAKGKPLFDILYGNQFPPQELMDEKGYMPLLDEGDIKEIENKDMIDRKVMGIDPAGEGRDESKWVIRDPFKAIVAATEKISSPMSIAQRTMTLMMAEKIPAWNVYIDSFGIGAAVIGELARAGVIVNGVNVGDHMPKDSDEDEKFYNKRAWMFWMIREWIKTGGQLVKNSGWSELKEIKYRAELNRKLKIMGKDEMRTKGIMSPNTADALSLCFANGKDILGDYEPQESTPSNRYSVV